MVLVGVSCAGPRGRNSPPAIAFPGHGTSKQQDLDTKLTAGYCCPQAVRITSHQSQDGPDVRSTTNYPCGENTDLSLR